jgi:hypothetical protein
MRIAVLPRKYNLPVVPGVPQGEIDDGCILHFWLPPKLERMKAYGFGMEWPGTDENEANE